MLVAVTVHLIKLCVGCDSVADLEAWILERRRSAGSAAGHVHTTRMVPKRRDDLLEGGSLFWVIKGQLSCRQRLLDLQSFTDGEGVGRCRLVLDPTVVPVSPRPCRPFQGWRYLTEADAPADLGDHAAEIGAMPETLRRELVSLGLL
jgi:hypothetical protein